MLLFLAIGVSYVCPRISAFFILGHSHPCILHGNNSLFLVYKILVFILFLQAVDLQIDESSFTGETKPSLKNIHKKEHNGTKLATFRNIAYMGTLVRCGHGKVRKSGFLI